MHISSCLHPQRIYNKYLDRYMYVPCRKCDACRNLYQMKWQQRLSLESRLHKYVYFFTLTYDEFNVPTISFSEDGSHLVNSDCSICININKYLNDDGTKVYLDSREVYPVVNRKDVQDFVKRFRSNCSYLLKKAGKNFIENEKIRYFICSEYGPRTYRSHYHGIFFFDSPTLSKNIDNLLHKSWKKGYTSVSACNEKRIRYVAKYVSCIPCLPKIYEDRSISPFFLCSKQPALGFNQDVTETFKETFFECRTSMQFWNDREYVDIPLFRYVENRLFPKCKGFSSLSHIERVALYSVAEREVLQRCHGKVRFVPYDKSVTPLFPVDCNGVHSADISLYRMSCRAFDFCRRFNITIDDYVTQIENYYVKKDYNLLVEQLKFEELYSYNHPGDICQFLHLDGVFLDSVLLNSHSLSVSSKLICKGFGLDVSLLRTVDGFKSVANNLSLENSFDYKSVSSVHSKIIRDSMRRKSHNDYIDYNKYKSDMYYHSF